MSKLTARLCSLSLLGCAAHSLVGCSEAAISSEDFSTVEQEVVYDGNSLTEVGNLPYWHVWFDEARATAALVERSQLDCDGSECTVESYPHETGVVGARELPLCSDEPFVSQPVAARCTAFLIADDLMATAGHCARSANWCQQASVVFNHTVNRNTGQANTTFDQDREVYHCEELVALGYEGSEVEHNDFAVFRLDRKTKGRMPLPLRQSGTVPTGASLAALGTPLGLPLKLDSGGSVKLNDVQMPRFETTIDAGPGSSGGPVFHGSTRVVEGIIVDGPSKIYELGTESDGSECARSLSCSAQTGCAPGDHRFVLVSRIERVVEVLQDRSCYDGKQNAYETDVDCGGPDCEPCDPGGSCLDDGDCGAGFRPPECHVGACEAGTCTVDTSSCECQTTPDCDDGDPCTRDHCGRNVCYHYTGECN